MSINPVASIGSMADAESAAARAASAQAPQVARGSAYVPDSGGAPKQETPVVQATAPVLEIPQDEVQVQRDSQANNEIVIRYVDGSGNLVLQVPSSEVLKLAQAIAQTFERQASSQADRVEVTTGEGGNPRGH